MSNKTRGDSELVAVNQHYTMRLTLGALAEIEDALGVSSLGEIATRLRTLATSDIAAVASALLRGGGHNISASDVLALDCDLGSIVRAIAGAFEAAGLAERQSGIGNRQSEAPDCRLPTADCRADADKQRNHESPLAGAASSNSPSA